ncbi:MAG: hypothetical protein NTV48_02735, partial [Candidatus Vogelbacteria bacterium]|nr:hypothetical protein [Candidatus Vogelbacteria bacterium]
MEKGFKNKNFAKGFAIGVVITAIIILVVFSTQEMIAGNLSPDAAKTKVTDFVNTKLLGGQSTTKQDQIIEDNKGVYKLKFTINNK